jgi:D-beta-D-heptose 7-phosphate kinase/D-beta-D-heptose 1-phosphate adenosyltransferase
MTETRSHTRLAASPGKRILLVGDVILDEYIWGDVRRISPEAPVPVVEVRRRTYLPGGAANAAANVVSLGGDALLGGVIGRDSQAGQLCEALAQAHIAADGLIVDPERLTTTKTRIIAHSQQVVRMDSEHRDPLPSATEDALLLWAVRHLANVDACILSDYAKGVVSPRLAQEFIRRARQAGKPVVVDPKGTDYARYRGATVIKPNIHEVERVLKQEIHDDADLLQAGSRLTASLDGTAVLITRGPRGMSLFRPGVAPVHIATVAHNVFDVTGAGDTVVATLAIALGAAVSFEQAVVLANQAAGIVVGKVGTATVTLDELRGAS